MTLTEGRDLFTPQQLFGEVESSADVLSHAPFLERARDEHERERELSARLALGAYLVSRLVDRLLVRDGAAGAAEGILWQLDAVRRHLRELPADAPESAHLHGITDAIPVGSQSLASLRLSLMAYAYFLEHEGRLEEAIEILELAVRTHGLEVPAGDFAASALFAGRLNRLLARWTSATACYSAAEAAATIARSRPNQFDGQFGTFGLGETLYRPFFDLAPRTDRWPAEIMNEYARLATAAARAGWHIHEHVINNSAVTDLLDTLERVNQKQPIGRLRWTMGHV